RQSLGNLAHLLCTHHRYAEAGALCDEYLRRYPDAEATVWIDRGICQHHSRDHAGAEASFERALALAPDDPIALLNLGSVLAERDEFERAEKLLTRVVAQNGANGYAVSLLAHCRTQLCAWDGLGALHDTLRRLLESDRDDPVNAFAALSAPLAPALQLRVAQRWSRDLEASPVPESARPSRANDGRLRLGYVSSDFRTHATASLL